MNTKYPGISFISEPLEVSMADRWYDVSDQAHFWIQRRFKCMERILNAIPLKNTRWLDVGCGTGLLQEYCRRKFDLSVDGADLNICALSRNSSGKEHTFCYNILNRDEKMFEAYDIVSVMDVIEHIDDEHEFLEALLYHLKPGGYLLGNVPAMQALFSRYDLSAGHKRRYAKNDLFRIVATHRELNIAAWSYWGLPLVPVILLRNLVVAFTEEDKIIEKGFSPTNSLVNRLLSGISRMEFLPNHFFGTSMMFLFQKSSPRNFNCPDRNERETISASGHA